jgi:hypothetical protein
MELTPMDLVFKHVWGTSVTEHFNMRMDRAHTDQDVLNELLRGIRLLRKYNRWISVSSLRDSLHVPTGPYIGFCQVLFTF